MLKKVEVKRDEEGREVRTDANGKEYTVINIGGMEFHEYKVPIRENNRPSKQRTNWDELEKELLSECESNPFPDEYYNYDWNDTPAAEKEEKNITEYNFLHGDYRHNQYHIYKQLVNISSLLSDIKEVLSDGNKAK